MTMTRDRRPRAQGGDGHRAVLVEDDLGTLDLLRDVATAAGWDAAGFTRLATARRDVREHLPELVVIDEDLPDGRGLDLVRELRANPRTRDVKVLFCTGVEGRRREEIAQLAPVIDKPFRLRELESALDRHGSG